MSQLLINWLKQEIKIQREIKADELDSICRSGFIFAQIFKHYRILDSLDGISDNPLVNVAIKNYSKLEPYFRASGVAITSANAYDLITGKNGVAAKTLYQLKTTLTDRFSSSSVGDESSLMGQGPSVQKKKFNEKEHEFFVDRLKARFPRDSFATASNRNVVQLEPIKQEVRRIESESKSINVSKLKIEVPESVVPQQHRNKPPAFGQQQHVDPETQRYLWSLNERKTEELDIKKQRSMRRDIILEERRRIQEEMAKETCTKLIDSYLTQKSRQESEFETNLQQMMRLKDDIIRNRKEVNREYEVRREQEYKESLRRDQEMSGLFKQEMDTQGRFMNQQMHVVEEAYKILKREKHSQYFLKFSRQLVEYAIDLSETKSLYTGGDIPKSKLYEMKLLFDKGYPVGNVYSAIQTDEDKVVTSVQEINYSIKSILPSEKSLVSAGIDELDDIEYQKYMDGTEEWSYSNESPVVCEDHVKIVDTALKLAKSDKPKDQFPNLTNSRLRIALLGKPFSGKTSIARELAYSCNLEVLETKSLFQKYLTLKDDGGNEFIKQAKDLAKKAEDEFLLAGKEIPDNIINLMIANEVKRLNSLAKGWIMVGYPRTREQAADLEREISGYEEAPKAAVVKGGKKAPAKDLKKKPSALEAEASGGPLKSYLDKVFVLSVDPAVAFRRMVGRRLDPVSGRIYNLEFNPPAADEPGVLQRLTELSLVAESVVNVQCLSFDENSEPLKEWFVRFNNYTVLDANKKVEDVRTVLEQEIRTMIDAKAAVGENVISGDVKQKTVIPKLKAIQLTDQFIVVEDRYISTIKYVMRCFRRERDLTALFMSKCKKAVKDFLQSTNPEKEKLFVTMQEEFKAIPANASTDPKVKAEWIAKSEEGREKLYEACDKRRETSENERAKLISSKWAEDHMAVRVDFFSKLFHSELERFVRLVWFLQCYKQLLANENYEIPPPPAIGDLASFEKPADLLLFEDLLKTKTQNVQKEKAGDAKGRNRSSSISVGAPGKKVAVAKKGDEGVKITDGMFVHTQFLSQLHETILKKSETIIEPIWSEEWNDQKKNFNLRLLRARNFAVDNLKGFKSAVGEFFQSLDDVIGAEYTKDIEAVKDFSQKLLEKSGIS